MKKIIILSLSFFGLFANAEAPSNFYSVVSYNCLTETGSQIYYSRDSKNKKVSVIRRSPTYSELSLWNDGGRYFKSRDISEIMFTGHRPSAGPPFDPFESDYVFRIKGQIQMGEAQRYTAELYENKAFTRFRKVENAECEVEIERMF